MIKKLLLSLVGIITIGLVNFSNAEIYDFYSYDQYFTVSSSSDFYLMNEFYNSPVICFDTVSPGGAGAVSFNGNTYNLVNQFVSCYMFLNNTPYHLDIWGGSIRVSMFFDSSTIDNEFSSSCDYSQYEAQINTLSGNLATCQSNYDTLNLNCNSLDSSYKSCLSDLSTCQNDLLNCGGSMTGDCQQNTGDIQRSSLYINDIQHLGSENINITIPEEISWNYTGNDQIFDLTVEGYNTDSDYIAGIITTQNSKPSKSDLNYIISSLLPLFVPGLVIILFIYFVFKFIKKAF